MVPEFIHDEYDVHDQDIEEFQRHLDIVDWINEVTARMEANGGTGERNDPVLPILGDGENLFIDFTEFRANLQELGISTSDHLSTLDSIETEIADLVFRLEDPFEDVAFFELDEDGDPKIFGQGDWSSTEALDGYEE